jgi:hypothetical protein
MYECIGLFVRSFVIAVYILTDLKRRNQKNVIQLPISDAFQFRNLIHKCDKMEHF